MRRFGFARRFWLAGALAAGVTAMWAQDDPPSRVARLNYVNGSVSFQAAGHDDWQAAQLNYPLTTGDRLWADDNSRAEMHIGSTAIRLDVHTAVAFLNLDDRITQLRLSDGTVSISIHHLEGDESYEVDTPNGAVTLLRPGKYRIDADPDREQATVTVRSGEAEVTAGGSAFPVHARQSAFITGTDTPATEVRGAISDDDFDRWWENRDDRYDRRPPPRYVSREMAGYEDLDDNGSWRDYPEYGPVWVPRVEAGWAPYRYGHWAWVEPWGWTWIDDASWGFAPFHYGRWCYVGGGWGWVPGPVVVRPVYAPALVAFVGGNNWAVGLSFGGGGGVGWFPLGPREIYRPSYRVSNTYVTQVNVTNITNVNVTNINNTNVTNVRYVNQTVPGAVTAVSHADFASSRPVARAAVVVPPAAVARAQVVGTAPQQIGREQAMAARPVSNVPVARPPQAAMNVPVVTKTPPPAATTSMARPTGVAPYRPATPNRPGQPAVAPQPAQVNRPGQPAQVYQPQAQPQRPNQPAYRPPAEQARPQNEPVPQAQPQRPNEPAYRPPPAQPQRQNEPAYRPPPAQPQRQNEPVNRQPPPQARPESEPRHHPDRPPEAQPRPSQERRQPPPRTEKEKERPKNDR